MSKIKGDKEHKLKRTDKQDFQAHINKDLSLLEIVNEIREMKDVKPLQINDQLTYITQMEADLIKDDIDEEEAVKSLEDGITKHINNQKLNMSPLTKI